MFNIFTFLKILKDQKVKCINYTNYNIDEILVFTFGSFSLDTFIVKHDKPTTFIVFRIFNLISISGKVSNCFQHSKHKIDLFQQILSFLSFFQTLNRRYVGRRGVGVVQIKEKILLIDWVKLFTSFFQQAEIRKFLENDKFQREKHEFLIYSWAYNSFQGTVVNSLNLRVQSL